MNIRKFHITGRVVDRNTEPRQGIAGLRVEAWDKDLIFKDLVGQSEQTDADGRFAIDFDATYFREIFLDRYPDLYFRIFRGTRLLVPETEPLLRNVGKAAEQETGYHDVLTEEVIIEIDLPQDGEAKPFIIRGTVCHADGSAFANAQVEALDWDLRSAQSLGIARADAQGQYEIHYTAEQFSRPEKDSADLTLNLCDETGNRIADFALEDAQGNALEPLMVRDAQGQPVSVPILFNAPKETTLNPKVRNEARRGPSDYATLLAVLTPLLNGLAPADITEEDINFLVRETAIVRGRILALAQAARLAVQANKADLPTEVFYGLARKGLPVTTLKALLGRPLAQLETALREAQSNAGNLIPAMSEGQIGLALAALQVLMQEQASEDTEEGQASFRSLLETCSALDLIGSARIDTVLRLLPAFEGAMDEFWALLTSAGNDFTTDEVNAIRFTLQFGSLTRNHAPMVKALQMLRTGDAPLTDLRQLAALDQTAWLAKIETLIDGKPVGYPADTPGKTVEEQKANYANELFRQVEAAFPTAAIAYHISAPATPWVYKQEIADFLLGPENFDLAATRIEAHYAQAANPPHATASQPEQEGFKQELKTLQRLFKLSPRLDHINALKAAGFNSARSIAGMTRESFVSQFTQAQAITNLDNDPSERESTAINLYNSAVVRSAIALNLWSKYAWFNNNVLPLMVKPPQPPATFIEDNIPNLSELFGSVDYCACADCQSAHSPAAYFVELLQFIKNETQTNETGKTGLYTLFNRRPDLAHIDLTCANTHTPLPYVDLVNEVLEWACLPPMLQPQVDTSGYAWPQTTWTADELAANPEHTMQFVYELGTRPCAEPDFGLPVSMRDRVYPWNLPFDLNLVEAKIYLKHLGIPRHQLLEAFHQGSAKAGTADEALRQVFSDAAIAREYLEMTQAEWDLLAGMTEDWPALWGLTESGNEIPNPYDEQHPIEGTWIEVLSHAFILLQRAGLSFPELEELLTLDFINPNGDIILQYVDLCNLAQIRIHFPDGDQATALRRICIFLRLQRRLGWPYAELNQALAGRQDPCPDFLGTVPLSPDEIKDLPALLNKLRNDPQQASLLVSQFLWENFDASTKALLDDPGATPAQQRSALVDALNLLILGNSIYEPTRFAGLALRQETASLIGKNLSNGLANRLNRLLLEDAYPGEIANSQFLIQASQIARLQARINIPLAEMLCWWGDIPTKRTLPDQPSIFESLFLDKSVLAPDSSDWAEFAALLSSAQSNETIADHLPRISAALGLGAEDLQTLADWNPWQPLPIGTSAKLTVPNLSRLYRLVSACKALKLSVAELTALVELRGMDLDPFGSSKNPAHMLLFAQARKQIRDSGFTILELDYLLRHRFESPNSEDADLQQITLILEELRIGLQKIADQSQPSSDPAGELLAKQLEGLGWPLATVTKFIETLGDTCEFSTPLDRLPNGLVIPAPLDQKIRHDLEHKQIVCTGVLTAAEKDILLALPCDPGDELYKTVAYQPAIENIHRLPRDFMTTVQFLDEADIHSLFDYEKTISDRFVYARAKIIAYIADEAGRSFVKQKLSQTLKLEPAIAEGLLVDWIKEYSGDRSAISVFLDDSFIRSDSLIRQTFAEQREAMKTHLPQYWTLTKLRKAACILARLRFDIKGVCYLFEEKPIEWLDLNALPVEDSPSAGLYAGWARLVDVCRLRKQLGATAPDLFDLMALASVESEEDCESIIAGRYGWQKEDIQALCRHFEYSFPGSFVDERPYLRLQRCFDLGRRAGVRMYLDDSASNQQLGLINWTAEPVTARIVSSIRQAAKSKYDNTQWRTIAKPLQDGLRQQKRDALLGYLTGCWNWTPNDIYACYLIDAEMQACMMSSRVKQAIGSVQLFVQRCLLGLEKGVEVSTEGTRRWNTWMKNYRIWEANKKIFLYPENWIEPGLRDDKTPFFIELENEFRQHEITPELAEKVFQHYLEKLDSVSRLEILAQYYDQDSSRHYLFGRTHNTPHVHYFRVRESDRVWGPWEKIDLDIDAEQLIPVVWNRRLYLFWPLFKEKSQKAQKSAEGKYSEARKHWEIRLAWSEYWQDKWSPVKTTKQALIPSVTRFTYKTKYKRDVLVIDAYEEQYGEIKNRGLFYFQPLLENHALIIRAFYVKDYFWRLTPVGEYYFNGNMASPTDKLYSLPDDQFVPYIEDLQNSIFLARKSDVLYFCALTRSDVSSFQQSAEQGIDIEDLSPTFLAWFWTTHEEKPFSLIFLENLLFWCSPIIAQDHERVLIIQPKIGQHYVYCVENDDDSWRYLYVCLAQSDAISQGVLNYELEPLFSPFTQPVLQRLFATGIDGVLKPNVGDPLFRQDISATLFGEGKGDVNIQYVTEYKSKYKMAFDAQDAYALYHWELFFHIPLLMADRLMQNQRFAEAMQWFHYIFDPTEMYPPDDPARGAWRFGRFYEISDGMQTEEQLMLELNKGDENLIKQVKQWRDNPFKPHILARLRTTPYMKTVVMKYIDNLLAWGDQLYRRDTIESINEATQLYVLAAEILGPKPTRLPAPKLAPVDYWGIKDRIDASGNVLVDIENEVIDEQTTETSQAGLQFLPNFFNFQWIINPSLFWSLRWVSFPWWQNLPLPASIQNLTGHPRPAASGRKLAGEVQDQDLYGADSRAGYYFQSPQFPSFTDATTGKLYFGIPPNSTLLAYWDTVADRLFKIRHCMNIEGVVRQLPLFEPPIEPGLLVRAAAAGIDFSTILGDAPVPLPYYRFSVMLQKALELCAEVKALGAALLSALEKKDAEELALLRSGHERRLLDAISLIKERQVAEADASVQALEKAKELAELRLEYYSSREFMNSGEKQHLTLTALAMQMQQLGQFLQLAASSARQIPEITGGYVCMGGTLTTKPNPAGALEASAWYFNSLASMWNFAGSQSLTMAGHQRRKEEWELQRKLAETEIKQIDKQITAARIRHEIAENDESNHALQVENSTEVDDYLRSKFTNLELYDWMVSQLSTIYFQSYQLAFDTAKRAEKCHQYELGLCNGESNFIQFGYWDSLKKGLLAGEKLHYDLRRLENAYLEQNRREFELTKHISLLLLDAPALVALRETGRCFINLPEEIFDLDFPGHYFRRIKSVSITLPCVAGPYTTVACTLRMLKNSIRIDTSDGDKGYPRNTDAQNLPADDIRFIENNIPVKAIATSSGQNDSGVFELGFRDERYLPFEGAGVVSQWSLELFSDPPSNNPDPANPDFGKPLRQFDYATLSDAILHIKYTAREDSGAFKDGVIEFLRNRETPSLRLFNLRQEFPTQWHRFLNPADPAAGNVFELEMSPDLFRILDQGKTLTVNTICLLARCTDSENYTVAMTPPLPVPPPPESNTFTLAPSNQYGGLHFSHKDVTGVEVVTTAPPVKWQLEMAGPSGKLRENEVEDVLLVVEYSWLAW